ncbi:MAG TPA: hypothetical protein VFV65_01875 [Gemmatimonadales bacterium]|nr:hypothetical protein [Gemmatimonadales bacterium]
MFIELTDILRCPAEHDESVLVLLPDGVHGRQVESGHLGCMECGKVYEVRGGAAEFAPAPVAVPPSERLTGPAMAAFLGLGGPGGYVAMVGAAAAEWAAFAAVTEGVHVLAVNAPPGTPGGPGVSLATAARLPVKGRHLRGVVLGPGFADDAGWRAEAVRALLPGGRVVGEGTTPSAPELEVLASADGVWVARTVAR